MISKEIVDSIDKLLQQHAKGSNIHDLNGLRQRLLGFYNAYAEAEKDQKLCEEKCQKAITEALKMIYDLIEK